VRAQEWLADPALAAIGRSFLVDEYEAVARSAGVDASVLVQTVTVADETSEMCEIAENSSVVQAVVGWIDLTSAGAAHDLERLLRDPHGRWLRGIRHQVQGEPDPAWLCRDDVRAGLAVVADAGLVYEVLVFPEQLPAVIETVRDLPQLRFVLDHCAKPAIASGDLTDWAARVRELATLPNVACKLSGLVMEADWEEWQPADLRPVAEVVIEAFGAGRVMVGSDWPVCLLAGSYDEVLTAYDGLLGGCSPDEQAAMRGGNAAATYRMP